MKEPNILIYSAHHSVVFCFQCSVYWCQLSKTYYNVLFGSFTRDRHARRIYRQSADIRRITLNASCMTISGERTEQLDIFCRITGFTSDFISFIVVELIRFFHGALQL